MCGIAGFSLSSSALFPKSGWHKKYISALAHRGPDGHGFYEDVANNVGLIHTRLSILDISELGHQPMLNDEQDVVLSFNGEIYNFSEIRDDLESQGYSFRSSSDTEVLLAAYLQCRLDQCGSFDSSLFAKMLNRLNGIFAFAIWDKKFHILILARDSFGVKPLYVQSTEDGIFFGSEIKCLDVMDSEIDCSAIDRYLTFLWNPSPTSPVNNLFQVPPGSALVVSKGEIIESINWYNLPTFKPISLNSSTNDLAQGCRFYLRQAVRRQLVADVPVGAFLSGGLDSSSIVAFAREIKPNISCFTINVAGNKGEGFSDDLPYARDVANHLNVSLDVVNVDAATMAKGIQDMVWMLDEPLADPAPLNVFLISRFAREHGIKVLLSGAGGDDIFTGYRRHYALHNEYIWRWLPRPLRICVRELANQLPVTTPSFRRLRKIFSGAHLEGDERLIHYFKWINRRDLYRLYTPDFRAALDLASEDPMLEYLANLPRNLSPLDRMLALEQRFFLAEHNLTYTDKMSMAAGVEVRVPFLDSDLVEFASRIPVGYKQRGRHGKWIFKKAMEPLLPPGVIYRPKSGFGAPLRSWLRYELRDWLSDVLSEQRLSNRGLFDPVAVHQLMRANCEGRIDASYTLLSLAFVEIWCDLFLGKSRPLPSFASKS